MKIVKLYIDDDFIKSKLGDEYYDCSVIFKDAAIGNDNTLTFECIVTDEKITNNDISREKII